MRRLASNVVLSRSRSSSRRLRCSSRTSWFRRSTVSASDVASASASSARLKSKAAFELVAFQGDQALVDGLVERRLVLRHRIAPREQGPRDALQRGIEAGEERLPVETEALGIAAMLDSSARQSSRAGVVVRSSGVSRPCTRAISSGRSNSRRSRPASVRSRARSTDCGSRAPGRGQDGLQVDLAAGRGRATQARPAARAGAECLAHDALVEAGAARQQLHVTVRRVRVRDGPQRRQYRGDQLLAALDGLDVIRGGRPGRSGIPDRLRRYRRPPAPRPWGRRG